MARALHTTWSSHEPSSCCSLFCLSKRKVVVVCMLKKFVYITDGVGIQQDKFSWERDEGSNIFTATLIHTTYVLLLAWLFKMQSVAHKQGSLFAPRFHATSKHTWTVLLLQFYRDAVWLQTQIHHVFLQHRGPRIKLMNNFAKGSLYVPCHEAYPTCEMQSRCFKPLSIGLPVMSKQDMVARPRTRWCLK
jgi:hypothetical protein